jgi:caffeoyl-CoA O-methyltransferase
MENFDPDNIIEKYIQSVSTEEDVLLAELNRYTHLKIAHPRMISGQVQGKVLEMLSRMLNPKKILEIGTFTGYSSICLARGLQPDGLLISIEINDELREKSNYFFKKAGLENQIEIINGDALNIIPSLNHEFDLAFIDGEKEQYIDYYELIISKIRVGGFILADNTLWGGKVLDEPYTWDSATKAIVNFNIHVQKDSRVENVLIPLRDGLTMIRKKEV